MKILISKLKLVFLSFLGLFTSSMFGQGELPEVVVDEGKGLLWEISGQDMKSPSYLYGTIHIISEKDFVLTDATKFCISKSEQMVMELDMDDPRTMMGMMTKMMMKDGQSLKSLLHEDDYEIVADFFSDSLEMNLMLFEKMKPFMALSAIYPNMLGDKTASYEMEFMKLAKKASMEIEGLESVEDQLGIFDKIPYEEQAQMMVEFIKGYSDEKGKIQEMIDLYVDQDLKGLYEFTAQSPEMEGYQDLMLDNRNENWIPKMKEMMENKVSFFAVGAGHLWGEKGIINLLKKEGYHLRVLP